MVAAHGQHVGIGQQLAAGVGVAEAVDDVTGAKEKLGALSVRKAVSLSPGKAQEVIREAARRAMSKVGSVEPWLVDPPYTMRVQYTEEKYTVPMKGKPGMVAIDETTVEQVRERFSDLIF